MVQYRKGRANLIGLVIDSSQDSDADLDECISWFGIVIAKRLPKLLRRAQLPHIIGHWIIVIEPLAEKGMAR